MWNVQVGCMIGCECSGAGKEMYPTPQEIGCDPIEPTNNDPATRTWNLDAASPRGDWNKYMPWRAPGSARPLDACGIASGFKTEIYPVPKGFERGTPGSTIARGRRAQKQWIAGGTAEVGFTIVVNHGGGYQYRLCPADSAITEECFKGSPLEFASEKVTVETDGSRVQIPATDLSHGTMPPGSTWRRIPWPACNCDIGEGCVSGGVGGSDGEDMAVPYPPSAGRGGLGLCDTGLQFEAPWVTDGTWEEGYGYYGRPEQGDSKKQGTKGGTKEVDADAKRCTGLKNEAECVGDGGCQWYASPKDTCWKKERRDTAGGVGGRRQGKKESYLERDYGGDSNWNVFDTLKVPNSTGTFVLSWRWDAEQTPQVWTSCADISIVRELSGAATLHPSNSLLVAAAGLCFAVFAAWM